MHIRVYLLSIVVLLASPACVTDEVASEASRYEIVAVGTESIQVPLDDRAWETVHSLTDDDRAMTRLMRGCWVAFAKTGKPECEGAPSWPRYRAEDDQLMDFGITVQLRQNYRKAQLDAQEQAMDHERDLKRRGAQYLISEMQSEVEG